MTLIDQLLKRIMFLLLVIFSPVLLANPCAINGGIGETGINKNSGTGGTGIESHEGVGGTGIQPKNGTGGTGIEAHEGVGGTGIVGVITGFGSICIGELEVHLDKKTPLEVDGVPTKHHKFSIGQSVAIDAIEKNSKITATKINVFHQLIGPISSIDFKNNEIKVMNQKVSIRPALVKNLNKGQWVGVSGIKNNSGTLLATNINSSIKNKKAMIVGSIVKQSGNLSMGGTAVTGISTLSLPKGLGDMRVSGEWDGQKLKVEKVSAGPSKQMLQRVDQLYVQTYLPKKSEKQVINVAGSTLTVKNLNGNNANKPVLVKVKVSDGKVKVENIKPIKNTILNKNKVLNSETMVDKKEHYKEKPELIEVEELEEPEIEQPEKVEVEQPEKVEVEQPEKVEVEKPEKVEVEKPEKVEIEKPEKIEIEKPEKVEIEKPEKIEIE